MRQPNYSVRLSAVLALSILYAVVAVSFIWFKPGRPLSIAAALALTVLLSVAAIGLLFSLAQGPEHLSSSRLWFLRIKLLGLALVAVALGAYIAGLNGQATLVVLLLALAFSSVASIVVSRNTAYFLPACIIAIGWSAAAIALFTPSGSIFRVFGAIAAVCFTFSAIAAARAARNQKLFRQ